MTRREAVVDASVWVTVLVEAPEVLVSHLGAYDVLHAPEHVDVEILSALRGLLLAGLVTPERFVDLSLRIEALPVTRHPLAPLLPRCAELAYTVSAYDAAYVALAEGLGFELVTQDARLSRSPMLRCPVVLL